MKYIRTSDDAIIIFPGFLNHSDFASWNPKSAGEIKITHKEYGDLEAKCYGNSFTLNLKSDPEDSKLATFQLNNL